MKTTRSWSLLPFIFILLVSLIPAPAYADGPNQAGLVVDFGHGNVQTYCVSFAGESITGLDMLQQAGLELVTGFGGGAMCSINGVGCPGDDCWCQCHDTSNCTYWIYWHLKGGTWQYSGAGASLYQVHNSDIEGWVWGTGTPGGGAQPPPISFDQICQVATATPTNTPPPINTPSPTSTPHPPTATSLPPTSTSQPTNTPKPPATPTISFRSDTTTVVAGSCTTLRWDVENAREVYLDDQPTVGHAYKQICPVADETYRLRVISAAGEQVYQVTVQAAAPPPPPQVKATMPPATVAPTAVLPTTAQGESASHLAVSPTAEVQPTATPSLALPVATPPPLVTPPPTLTPRPTGTPRAIARTASTGQVQPTRLARVRASTSARTVTLALFVLGMIAGGGILAVAFAVAWYKTRQVP
jgi:hypothetical protein